MAGNRGTGSRLRRALATLRSGLENNWRRLFLDAVVVIVWTVVLAFAFVAGNWPRQLYYAVLVASVLAYTFAVARTRR